MSLRRVSLGRLAARSPHPHARSLPEERPAQPRARDARERRIMAERHEGYCTLCHSRCGSITLVENARMFGVEPHTGHPTGGALCAKGRPADAQMRALELVATDGGPLPARLGTRC